MKAFLLKIYYTFLKFKLRLKILENKLVSIIFKPEVRGTDETIDKIINEKCSISRYGDGEFKILLKGEQFFQEYNEDLRLRLMEILKSTQSKNHIVCIPDVFDNVDKFTERAKKFWTDYINLNRRKIYRFLDRKKIYYDAMVTRLYMDYVDKSKVDYRFQKFKKIWDGRDIVLVEGELSRLGAGNKLFNNSKSLIRILCPSENAFSKYFEILNAVKQYKKDKLILIALGPTATILAYDLSKLGYQAIDIGNIDIEYEWYLNRAQVKTAVKYKYTGEVPSGRDVALLKNEDYENEIRVRIL